MNSIKKLLFILTKEEKKKLFILFILVMMMALFDIIGITSIMPFFAVLSDHSLIERNQILSQIYNSLNFTDVQSFLLFLGILIFIIFGSSLLFKSLINLQLDFLFYQTPWHPFLLHRRPWTRPSLRSSTRVACCTPLHAFALSGWYTDSPVPPRRLPDPGCR